MNSLLSTPSLREKITDMKEKRETDNWTSEDEQILAFLLELLTLRGARHDLEMNLKKITDDVYKMHGKMQDEKKLLTKLN